MKQEEIGAGQAHTYYATSAVSVHLPITLEI